MKRAIAAAVLLMAAAWPGRAATYLILPDGTGDYSTIQAGLNAAVPGDTVKMGDGTFVGSGNRDLDFHGKGIVLTSASGDAGVCVIDCQGSASNYHRAIYFHSQEDSTAVVSGVTMTGGYFDSAGAIRCESSSPTIIGCIVRNNISGNAGAASFSSSNTRFHGCTFFGNTAASAGGALSVGYSRIQIEECIFTQNEGGGYAPGALDMYCSEAIVVNCMFKENRTDGIGGAILSYRDYLEIDGCLFEDNYAHDAGAIHIADFVHQNATIHDCTFLRNTAFSGCGGALWAWYAATIEVSHCTFVDNESQWPGGAMAISTEIANGTAATLDNNIIAFNSAQSCGGVAFSNVVVTAHCNDLFGNQGGDACGWGFQGNGNISLDPLFCDRLNGDLTLDLNSPCAPSHNPDCGLIGAHAVACPAGGIAEPGESIWHSARLWPNPSSEGCWIELANPGAGPAEVAVFNAGGRCIRHLSRIMDPSLSVLRWDGRDEGGNLLPAGMYLVTVRRGGEVSSSKVIVR